MTFTQRLLQKTLYSNRFWSMLLGAIFFGGLSLYILYMLVFQNTSWPDLREIITRVGVDTFLISSFAYALAMVLSIVAWRWMMGVLSGTWSWYQHTCIYGISTFTRRLPTIIWYILGRIVLYERLGVARATTAFVSGLELTLLITSALIITVITWPIAMSAYTLNPIWFIGGLLLGLLLLNPRVLRALIRRINPQSEALQLRYRHLCAWLFIYAGVWCGNGAILFILTTSINHLPLSSYPAILGVATTSSLVALLFNFVPFGLGINEVAITVLLGQFVSNSEALVVAVLSRGVLMVNEFVWAGLGGIGWLVRPNTPVQHAEQTGINGQGVEEVIPTEPAIRPK